MLARIARAAPNLSCSVFFSDLEWKAAVAATTKSTKIPDIPPSVHDMLIMVASLGGYLNRKGDPAPGATVIWRGFTYLKGFADAFAIFSNETNADPEIAVKNTLAISENRLLLHRVI